MVDMVFASITPTWNGQRPFHETEQFYGLCWLMMNLKSMVMNETEMEIVGQWRADRGRPDWITASHQDRGEKLQKVASHY